MGSGASACARAARLTVRLARRTPDRANWRWNCIVILRAIPASAGGKAARWRAPAGLSLRASVRPLLAFTLASQYLQYRQEVAATGQRNLRWSSRS
jgi:hypothetical protein